MAERFYHINTADRFKSVFINQALDQIGFLLPDARNVISRYQEFLFPPRPQPPPQKTYQEIRKERGKPLEASCILVGSSITRKVIRGERIREEDKEQYRHIFSVASRELSRSSDMNDAMDEISADWLAASIDGIIVISRLLHIERYTIAN